MPLWGHSSSIFSARREPPSKSAESCMPFAKPVRDIAVQLDRNFAAASLGFQDARQGDELAGYSRISSVTRL